MAPSPRRRTRRPASQSPRRRARRRERRRKFRPSPPPPVRRRAATAAEELLEDRRPDSPVRSPASPDHEVDVQGGPRAGASVRGVRQDPGQVPRPRPGDRGKGLWIPDCGHRQEEVPGSLGHNRGSVHVDHQEADPVALREGHISLCRQDGPPVEFNYGTAL